MTLTTFPQVLS